MATAFAPPGAYGASPAENMRAQAYGEFAECERLDFEARAGAGAAAVVSNTP